MTRLSLVVASALLALSPACKSEKSKDSEGDKKATQAKSGKKVPASKRRIPAAKPDGTDVVADAHDPDKMGSDKEVPLLTLADYEKMMLALEGCALDGIKLSTGCPSVRKLSQARRSSRIDPSVSTLATKYITHESEPVRVHAASMMKSVLGAKDEHVKAALAAAANESSPAVLAQITKAVMSKQSSPAVAELILKLADHESALVRGEVAAALTSTFAAGVDGTIERAMKIAETDADMGVRERTCRELGRRVDERALPTLEKLTREELAAKHPKLYSACWRGLVQMVVSHPFFDKASEKAFDQFIERFGSAKCTKETPPWQVVNSLRQFTNPKMVAIAPWSKKRLPEVHKVLVRLAKCAGANWIGRAAAVDALVATGAPAKSMNSLRAAIKKASGDADAAKMLTKIDSVMKKK